MVFNELQPIHLGDEGVVLISPYPAKVTKAKPWGVRAAGRRDDPGRFGPG